jgi:hypothetical protein
MSHNEITVNSQNPTSTGDIAMSVSSVVGDTPSTGEIIVGNASNQYEFGASPTPPDPLQEYFFVCNTNLGGSQSVTSYGYYTQYIDNRSGTVYNVESGIESTAQGGEGVTYGGGGSRMHAQIVVDQGHYFCEYYSTPKWTSSGGNSVFQYQQGNVGTAEVIGSKAYCYNNSPSRNFYAVVKSSALNQRVWPRIVSNAGNQTIGASYTTSQAMIAYKI